MNLQLSADVRITSKDIRAQLDAILASEAFARAPRMQRFLAYVIDETLAGRAHQLGEYGIGVGVFDRGPDFEPALDPIVRNDARRLRGKLREYYSASRSADAEVIIELPKGGYVPLFRRALPDKPPAVPSKGGRRVVVMPFELLTPAADSELCGRALCLSLTAGLTNVDGVETVAHGYSMTETHLSHVIGGCVWKSGDRRRIIVNLIELPQGAQIWAREYDFGAADVLARWPEISADVIREVKARLGVETVGPVALPRAA